MPKTPIKTFIALLENLNDQMDQLADVGVEVLERIPYMDINAINEHAEEVELRYNYLRAREKFKKINQMKQILLDGLRRKVMEEMTHRPASQLSTKSATMRRSHSSGRGKTQRRHSH